jgi:hypothetical protein
MVRATAERDRTTATPSGASTVRSAGTMTRTTCPLPRDSPHAKAALS